MNRAVVRMAGLAVVLLVGAVASVEAQTMKLGFINSQAVLAQAPGTPEAQAAFQASMQGYQQEISALETELQTLQDNLDRQGATLTAAVRQQRTEEIQQKYIAFQARQQELSATAEERQNELVAPIIDRIATVVEQIRTEGNYSIIFDVGSAPVIFTADPALDLTEQVLTRLRATAPPGATIPAPPATPPSQ